MRRRVIFDFHRFNCSLINSFNDVARRSLHLFAEIFDGLLNSKEKGKDGRWSINSLIKRNNIEYPYLNILNIS